nr:PAS domain-containing protein [Iningainema tapete]
MFVAVFTSALAVLLELLLSRFTAPSTSALLFCAVVVSSWYGSYAAGLLTTLLCSLASAYFFLVPTYSLAVATLNGIVQLSLFVGVSLLVSGLNTSVKRVERAIQESDNLLSAVIEETTDAVFVKDLQGRYQLINATTARIFGRTREEIIGKNDSELLPSEVVKTIQEIDRLVITTGRTQILEEKVPMAGSIRTYLSTKDPYRDAQGNVIGLIGIARDITERKQFEEALSRSNQRLTTLQEIDRAILRADSAEEIARVALSRMGRVVNCQEAMVVLFNFETNLAQVLAGRVDGKVPGSVVPITDLALPELQHGEHFCYIEDIGTMLQRTPLLERAFAEGMRSFLSMALVV